MATNWTAIEDAILAWVVASTGLAVGQVVFSDQNAAAPAGDYATVTVGDFIPLGGPAGTRIEFDAGADLGEEITHYAERLGELNVSVQAYTSATHGNDSARAVLEKAQAALELSTYRFQLNAVGLGVLDAGRVQWVPRVSNAAIEGRAVLDVRFALLQTAEQKTGYIATAEVTRDVD